MWRRKSDGFSEMRSYFKKRKYSSQEKCGSLRDTDKSECLKLLNPSKVIFATFSIASLTWLVYSWMFSGVPSSIQLNTSVFFLPYYDNRNYLQMSNGDPNLCCWASLISHGECRGIKRWDHRKELQWWTSSNILKWLQISLWCDWGHTEIFLLVTE